MINFGVNFIKDFKNLYKNNKDFFPIIILIPTIIGGIWQILELMTIDPSFLRFFSISQLVSDGILIITLLTIVIVYLLLLKKKFNLKDLGNVNFEKNQFNLKIFIASILLFFIYIFLILYVYYTYNLDDIKSYRVKELIILLLGIGFFIPLLLENIISITIELLKLIFGDITDWKAQLQNKKSSFYKTINILSIIILIGKIIIFFGAFSIFIEFRKKIILPENLENLKSVKDEIKKEYGQNQKFSILYLNDKYIFIELDNQFRENDINNIKPKKIKIYRTEDILFK